MSFADIIRDSIYENIDNYNKIINKKYNIPHQELMNLFFSNISENIVEEVNEEINEEVNGEVNEESKLKNLRKKSKAELQKMCEDINQSCKGKKDELIKRIMKGKVETVVDKIKTSITSIIVKKNKFDNYEHIESGLVFNKTTKCVIGKQDHNTGNVLSLNEDDIEICQQYKFKFNIPKNLNENEDEILEDEDEDEDEEEEYEEEEEED